MYHVNIGFESTTMMSQILANSSRDRTFWEVEEAEEEEEEEEEGEEGVAKKREEDGEEGEQEEEKDEAVAVVQSIKKPPCNQWCGIKYEVTPPVPLVLMSMPKCAAKVGSWYLSNN